MHVSLVPFLELVGQTHPRFSVRPFLTMSARHLSFRTELRVMVSHKTKSHRPNGHQSQILLSTKIRKVCEANPRDQIFLLYYHLDFEEITHGTRHDRHGPMREFKLMLRSQDPRKNRKNLMSMASVHMTPRKSHNIRRLNLRCLQLSTKRILPATILLLHLLPYPLLSCQWRKRYIVLV